VTEQRITSRKNPLLQQVKKLLSSRKAREEAGLFAADGVKLLAEAVRWYPGLDTVILSDGVHADVPESVRLFRVPEDVMASISPMESPQGALFLCRLPERKAYVPQPGCLLLDGACPQYISRSLICRWFRRAVLPQQPKLEQAILRPKKLRRCEVCGTGILARSGRAKYCPACAAAVHRQQKAKSARKRRSGVDNLGAKSP